MRRLKDKWILRIEVAKTYYCFITDLRLMHRKSRQLRAMEKLFLCVFGAFRYTLRNCIKNCISQVFYLSSFLTFLEMNQMNRAKKIVIAVLAVALVLIGVATAYAYYASARVYGYSGAYGYNSPYGTSGSYGYYGPYNNAGSYGSYGSYGYYGRWGGGCGHMGGFGRGMW
jgi:hypothetical protein